MTEEDADEAIDDEHDAHWTLNLPSNVRLQGVPEKKLRALDAWEVNDAGEGKDAPRQVEP